ncbi:MAG TPA: amidohydrolase family protein [Stellaceae bacterium]|nr:amidohydrolase family protein [Stellaceae bacterium]
MHDIVIRGGTIVDGTGRPGFTGDVAIDGERIAAVGGKAGPARRIVDADGLLVTPGWVDVHTHYDGQASWDPILAPSSWHGVTTVLFGNCGVGFAPVRPHHRDALIDLMEGVEDIPGPVLAEGLQWDWESFPQYLDALERRPRTIDVAAQVPHHPLRVYVMGERAIRRERASADDVAEMRRLTEAAIRAGAFGFTTSRTNAHKTTAGEMVPGRFAEIDELSGIGAGLSAAGAGAFGMNSDFEDEEAEFAWITRLAKETGRPVWFLLTDRPTDPERWRRLIAQVHRARSAGAAVTAQVAGRPVGVILGVATSLNPFAIRDTYRRYDPLPLAERLVRLRDPAVRAAILADRPSPSLVGRLGPLLQLVAARWDRMYVMGDPPDYEPRAETSVAAIAAREGKTPDAVAYDYLVADAGHFLFFPVTGYVCEDHEAIRQMLIDPGTLLGLGDGGAHVAQIVDAGLPTYMLTHWARDRRRGPGLPLERVVKRQTSETADFFGFADRGRIAPGKRADLNLIDFVRLRLHAPEVVHDLPAGGKRLVQRAKGYEATLVAGVPIFERGQYTGATPGRLVRRGA